MAASSRLMLPTWCSCDPQRHSDRVDLRLTRALLAECPALRRLQCQDAHPFLEAAAIATWGSPIAAPHIEELDIETNLVLPVNDDIPLLTLVHSLPALRCLSVRASHYRRMPQAVVQTLANALPSMPRLR